MQRNGKEKNNYGDKEDLLELERKGKFG